ncbi:hypothetical protein [uncultured Bifidobacterium sp.]|nr:hypothetical protein [uncultured Bifidobacterium sp.]
MTDADKLANAMIADLRDDLIDRLDGSVLVKASDSADLLYSQFASQLEMVKRDYLDTLLCQLALSVVAVVCLESADPDEARPMLEQLGLLA